MQNLGAPVLSPIPASLRTISEFRCRTPSIGRVRLGYGVENFTMKSGAAIPCDLFELLRNDKFDSRGFSTQQTAVRQNEFGGTVGGRCFCLGITTAAAPTFLRVFGLSSTRRPAQGNLVSVPTMQERTAIFRYPYRSLIRHDQDDGHGGFVRAPFTGNIILKTA